MKSFKSLLKKIRKDNNPDELEFVGLEIFNESSGLFNAASRKIPGDNMPVRSPF